MNLSVAAFAFACAAEWGALSERPSPSHGDTLAVADSLRRANGDCAKMVAAYALAMTTVPHAERFQSRLDLEAQLQQAFRNFPEEPRVFLALANLRLNRGMRSDAGRLLERARSRARTSYPPLTARERAVVAYLHGRLSQDEWRDWRRFGQLMGMTRGQWDCPALDLEIDMNLQQGAGAAAAAAIEGILPSLVTFNIGCPDLFERLMDLDFRPFADLKRHARSELEARYREAMDLDPTYWLPFQKLASEFVFEADWLALRELAARGVSQWPGRSEALAYQALAEYRLGRDAEARTMFAEATALMPASFQAIYASPELVLSVTDARTFRTLPADIREQVSRAYWRSREVLFLTVENERMLEHHARVTEADLLFGDLEAGTVGWNTSPGEIWVRFGRPAKIRDLGVENGRASFWSYGPDPDIVFTRFLTYSQLRVHEDAGPAFQQVRDLGRVRFRPPSLDSVVHLGGQVTRFRSRSAPATDLLLLAPAPRTASGHIMGGVTVLDENFEPVARWVDSIVAGDGIAVTVAGLPGGRYNVVLEALETTGRVLHQRRDTMSLGFPDSTLAMSDLLLARGVVGPDTAQRRQDLRIQYLYDTEVFTLDRLALYWEIYNPPVDGEGRARYTVRIEVTDAARRPLFARVVRALGRALAGTTPAAVIEYERSVFPRQGAIAEWVSLAADWESGTYEIVVTVMSATEQSSVSARRTFAVVR